MDWVSMEAEGMNSTDLKKMLVGLCMSGLLAGSGVGMTVGHASGG